MQIASYRSSGEDGRLQYRFTVTLTSADADRLKSDCIVSRQLSEETRNYLLKKVSDFISDGRTINVIHGYNPEICARAKYDNPSGFPVYFIEFHVTPEAVLLSHGKDPLGRDDVINPDYSKWDAVKLHVSAWEQDIKVSVFNFINVVFFRDYRGGRPDREFILDRENLVWREIHQSCPEQEEPKETTEDAPAETVNQIDLVVDFPDTMPGLAKYCHVKRMASKYDFGKYVLPPASSRPSPERAIRMLRDYHLLGIARALVARRYGHYVSTDEVRASTVKSWRNNRRMAKYTEVIRENMDLLSAELAKIPTYYAKYLEGNVTNTAKKFADVLGQPWDIKHYIIEMAENLHVTLKKLD